MSKSSNARHPADAWAAQIITTVPHAREWARDFQRDKDDFGDKWPAYCGLPMSAVYAIMTSGCDATTAPERLVSMGVGRLPELTAALIWSQAKAVYRFDNDLAAVLLDQPMDDALPPETVQKLPQFCVYIDHPIPISDDIAKGLFAWLECDAHTLVPELRLLYLMPDNTTVSMPLILNGGTIDSAIDALIASGIQRSGKQLKEIMSESQSQPIRFPSRQQIAGAVNMLLYLCSTDKDMPDEPIKRSRDSFGHPKHIRSWDVGIRVGNALRKYKQAVREYDSNTQHNSPRPHVRRAHWHHFWTGPREGEQKLILKWLSPIPVNFEVEATDLPSVITLVKK